MKSSIKITVKSITLVFLLSPVLFCQPEQTRFHSVQDTILTNEPEITDDRQDTIFVMEKSPWLAVLLSGVVPGLGQIYNESYIKAPIIWGTAALLIYGWLYNDDLYNDYSTLYQQTQDDRYRIDRNFYRDQRDLFTIYMGLAYLLNLVDAYVDAHLFDFNVEEDFLTKVPMLNLKINF